MDNLQSTAIEEVPESNPAASIEMESNAPEPTTYDLMLEKCYRDAMGNPYFWDAGENGNRPIYLDGKDAVDAYRYKAFQQSCGWPKKKDAKEAIDQLRIVTAKTRPSKPLHHRVQKFAQHGVELKLNNSQSVKITADEIVVSDHEGHFLAPDGELPLAIPDIEYGRIEPYLDALGLTDSDERILITGLLLVYLYPDIPYPVLLVLGSHGSGKTEFCGSLLRLIDNHVNLQSVAVTSRRDLNVRAHSRRVLCFENISEIDNELSDAICVISTGGNCVERKLYTNTGVSSITLGNPQIINGISNPLKRDDLRDRAVLIELPVRDDTVARDAYRQRVESTLPGALGHLIRALQAAVQNLEATTTPDGIRMADAARIVTAAESEFGWEPGTFSAAYRHNHLKMTREGLWANPVYEVLDRLLRNNQYQIEGTATYLLNLMENEASTYNPRLLGEKTWPKTANKLSEVLSRLEGSLAEENIHIAHNRTSASRTLRITKNTGTETG